MSVYTYSSLARRPERIALEDFRRIELDVPLLFGWSSALGHVWFGPKLVVSASWTDLQIRIDEENTVLGNIDGVALYYGVQIGAAIGWRFLWLAIEVTVAGLASAANTESSVISLSSAPSGLIIYPSAALILQFGIPRPRHSPPPGPHPRLTQKNWGGTNPGS